MKLAIVTDTNSGIDPQEAAREGIFLLPMPIMIDGDTYLEGVDLYPEQLYSAMKEGRAVSTSQPSPESLMRLWDSVLEKGYDKIIYIPMTSGLSGSCGCAAMLAGEYSSKIYVVDNHRISATQRLSVLEAKRMADQGNSAEEIKNYLEESSFQSSIYLTVESLKYLRDGGRLSPSAAMLGTLLNIRPVLSIQGEKIEAFAKTRGRKKCEQKMIKAIQTDISERFSAFSKENLHIDTAGTFEQAEQIEHWKSSVQEAFPDFSIHYFPLPCSIASHVGPGCAGIAVSVVKYF